MKKRLGLFLVVLLSLTFVFSLFDNGELAKAATFTGHYNDILIGTNNLNNTTNNSAKVGDILLSPEKGWKRYDNSNSKIQYLGQWHQEGGITKCYKNTYSMPKYPGSGNNLKFTFTGQKVRLISNYYNTQENLAQWYNAIEILDNGVVIGNSKLIQNKVGNDDQTGNRIGFEYTFNSYGIHNIEIRSIYPGNEKHVDFQLDAIDIDSNGEMLDSTVQYNPILTIESPIINNTYTGNFNLSGYALNKSGIKSVKVYIDGVYSRDTQIGIQRTDVASKYPSYPGAGISGFSTTYNVSNFSIGTHTMKVQSIGNDGTVKEQLLYLYVYSNYIIVQSTNASQKITDVNQIKAGDIISLRCMGSVEGNRWLDGKTGDASVWLAPNTGAEYSGTKWQVYSVNGYLALKCLGTYEGKGSRWLDGNTGTNEVTLAPNTGVSYSGTQWNFISNGDGTFSIKCMGIHEGNRWLDGNTINNTVSLAPVSGGQYSGTKWEIYKAN